MKKYIGLRVAGIGCEVYAEEGGKGYPLPLRLDLFNHSPDGFEWGYGGSGPAQLALAILADFLGPAPSPNKCPYCGSTMINWKCREPECAYDGDVAGEKWREAVQLHQAFKADVIAKLKTDRFVIEGAELSKWIEAHK